VQWPPNDKPNPPRDDKDNCPQVEDSRQWSEKEVVREAAMREDLCIRKPEDAPDPPASRRAALQKVKIGAQKETGEQIGKQEYRSIAPVNDPPTLKNGDPNCGGRQQYHLYL